LLFFHFVLSLCSESLSFSLSLLLLVFLRASSPLKRCRCLRNALAKKEESSHKQIRCLKCENPILREREKKNCLGFVPLLGFSEDSHFSLFLLLLSFFRLLLVSDTATSAFVCDAARSFVGGVCVCVCCWCCYYTRAI